MPQAVQRTPGTRMHLPRAFSHPRLTTHQGRRRPLTSTSRAGITDQAPLCFAAFQRSRRLLYLAVNSTSQDDGSARCPAAGPRTPPAPPAGAVGRPGWGGRPRLSPRSPPSAARRQACARPPPRHPRPHFVGPWSLRPLSVHPTAAALSPGAERWSGGGHTDLPHWRRQLSSCPSTRRRPSRAAPRRAVPCPAARTGCRCGPAHTARALREGGGSAGGEGPAGTPPPAVPRSSLPRRVPRRGDTLLPHPAAASPRARLELCSARPCRHCEWGSPRLSSPPPPRTMEAAHNPREGRHRRSLRWLPAPRPISAFSFRQATRRPPSSGVGGSERGGRECLQTRLGSRGIGGKSGGRSQRLAQPLIDPMRERAARRKGGGKARRTFSAQQSLGFAGARAQWALGEARGGRGRERQRLSRSRSGGRPLLPSRSAYPGWAALGSARLRSLLLGGEGGQRKGGGEPQGHGLALRAGGGKPTCVCLPVF